MWRRRVGTIGFVVGLLGLVVPPGLSHPYSYVPLDHWAYPAIRRFVALGLVPPHLAAAKPLMRDEIARIVILAMNAAGSARLSAADRALLAALAEEFVDEAQRSRSAERPRLRVVADGGMGSAPTLTTPTALRPGWSVAGEFGGRFGLLAVDGSVGIPDPVLRRASVSSALGPVRLQVGREALWWGPGARGALLVSDSAGPLDLFKLTWETSRIRFTKFIASLDQPGRYLAGTRVDWWAMPWLRLGLSETAVAFPSSVFWYHLVNPIPAILTDLLGMWERQAAFGANDNFLVAVDFDVMIRPGILLYGETMSDDIQSAQPALEGISLFPPRPSRWGFQVGLYLVDPFTTAGTDLRLEYSRIYNWTYGHGLPDRRYQFRGRSLGHWLGPDADDLAVIVSRRATSRDLLQVWAALTRHGEGRIDRGPADDADAWRNRFLSGVVEVRYSLGASWNRWAGPAAWGITAEAAYVRNRNNVSGDTGPAYFLGVTYGSTW